MNCDLIWRFCCAKHALFNAILLFFAGNISFPAHAIGEIGVTSTVQWSCTGANGTITAPSPFDACMKAINWSYTDPEPPYATTTYTIVECTPLPPGETTGYAPCKYKYVYSRPRLYSPDGILVSEAYTLTDFHWVVASWSIALFCGDGSNPIPDAAAPTACKCFFDFAPAADFKSCTAFTTYPTFNAPKEQCRSYQGNPIEPMVGRKTQQIDLGVTLGGISLALNYDSARVLYAAHGQFPPARNGRLAGFGGGWSASWLRSLLNLRTSPSSTEPPFQAFRSRDRVETFLQAKAGVGMPAWQAVSGSGDILQQVDASNLNYFATQDATIEQFKFDNSRWNPVRFANIGGSSLNVATSNEVAGQIELAGRKIYGLPTKLTDDFGRSVSFEYQLIPADGDPNFDAKIVRMKFTDGAFIEFGYSTKGDLISIKSPDGSLTELMYEASLGGNSLWTGIVDENGTRFSTFSYDAQGNAISTEHAGSVNRYSTTYATPPSLVGELSFDSSAGNMTIRYGFSAPTGTTLTLPNGSTSSIDARQLSGYAVPTSFSQAAGSGCTASTSSRDYDSSGNVTWNEDFNSRRVCYANDLSRNLETGRVDGLTAGSSCSVVLTDGAALPAGARKVSSSWHPVWRMKTRLAEPRRLTTKVYNGQPDPFAGGATAWCAPSNATLPDGSPIVVLCKQVEQATTDTNGAQGFAAVLDSGVPTRTQQWTYTQYGQVLTAKDARNNTTTYAYYPNTTADHTMGDLATVTNAKQQVTTYSKYNPAGQWLELVDANGIATTRTFDLRQRLKSVVTAGATTSYDYWPTGLIKKVTLPDASAVSYGYDDAHRLTSVTDNLGNSITYTLDNSGNRTGEQVKDPTGRLAKTLTRVPDALNRIQQVTGRE